MTATELLTKLQADGIEVRVDGSDLVLKGERPVLTAEVKEALREQKPQIIELLSANPCTCSESWGAAGCGPDYPVCQTCGYTWCCKACGGCRQCKAPDRKVRANRY